MMSKALTEGDDKTRPAAAFALARMGPAAEPAAPELAKALEDKNPRTRCEAMRALANLGPKALPAVSALEAAAQRLPAEEAVWARLALLKAGDQPGIQRFWIKHIAFASKSPAERAAGCLALLSAGEQVRELLPDLKAAELEHDDPLVREAMAQLVSRLRE